MPIPAVTLLASPPILPSALAYGIPADQILEFAEWVGGRYSLWSSIGLSIAISIGFEQFSNMLAGAREMDLHFQQAPLEQNMPVIMALLGIWYSNFLNAETIAVIPYCERLLLLPSYLQQLDMESNGKATTLEGEPVDYSTGPILWGQTGTNGQHAFFQLLHQGTRQVPIDFIAAASDGLSNAEHHRVLLGNMLAQSAALMTGQAAPEGQQHRYYPGNKPSNTLLLKNYRRETLAHLSPSTNTRSLFKAVSGTLIVLINGVLSWVRKWPMSYSAKMLAVQILILQPGAVQIYCG